MGSAFYSRQTAFAFMLAKILGGGGIYKIITNPSYLFTTRRKKITGSTRTMYYANNFFWPQNENQFKQVKFEPQWKC